MTPQELMDLPHHGMAEKELRKSKRWDEDAGKEEVAWKVKVRYDIQVVESETVTLKINARSHDEACEKVYDHPSLVDDDILDASIEILEIEEKVEK